MAASNSVLERYALAYIKKSGNSSNVKGFLRLCDLSNINGNLVWSEEEFEEIYNKYKPPLSQSNTRANDGQSASRSRQYSYSNSSNTQFGNTNTQNTHWSFWDCLLLQCCINNLLSGRSNTTVNNVTNNINYASNNQQSSVDKKKEEAEDGRKLLALGIAAVVVVIIFHVTVCYLYHSNKKAARRSDKIDYLDNKIKTSRNIEFASCAISLAALIACAVYPVLPAWGLIIIGVHSLACFAGGLAFHMKHEQESENIEKAKKAVEGYTNQPLDPNYQAWPNQAPPPFANPSASHNEAPPPYFPNASAPAYDNQSFVGDSGLYPDLHSNPSGQVSYADVTKQQFSVPGKG